MSLKWFILSDFIIIFFLLLAGGFFWLKNNYYFQKTDSKITYIKKASLLIKKDKGNAYFQATGKVIDVGDAYLIVQLNEKEKIKISHKNGIIIQQYLIKDEEVKIEKINDFPLTDLTENEVSVVGIALKKNFFEDELRVIKILIYPKLIKERLNLLN